MLRKLLELLSGLFQKPRSEGTDHHPGWYREPGKVIEEPIVPEPATPTKPKIDRFAKVRKWFRFMSYSDFLENAFWTFLVLVGATLGCFGLFSLFKASTTSGEVDYCFIERWSYIKEKSDGKTKPGNDSNPTPKEDEHLVIVWELKGHRNWRGDRDIGRFDSFETAISAAQKLNCHIEARDGDVSH